MPEKSGKKKLSAEECKIADDLAYNKTSEYNKHNDILGEQIFNILSKNSRVLFYPLEDDDVWGFFEKIGGNTFICINTSIEYDKQVFVAAHELYHLWFNHPEDLILAAEIEETDPAISINELMANRFAAAFLVPKMLLLQEIEANKIDDTNIDIPDIVRLARIFLVPYRTMVKRLCEIKKITETKQDIFLQLPEDQIDIWRTRLGLALIERTNLISLDVLIDKALSLFDKQLITREKLEYLLSFAKTTPEKMGIPNEQEYVRPSDDELQAIMEE